ncbi:hypothetical protein NESM_000172700 [Novymonas esmeraldas]|uniref:Uncharacterized protein n=1 Tax=Novymonas esmeraldas TaxID=1808958 RepID=A0AAW0F4J1_9TRYP
MTSHDTSAAALIAHMNDIERQRRVLSMGQKEQEAKITFAATERTQLMQAATDAAAEEARLREDLEALATEQQHLELQRMESTDRLRRTQEEEALHTTAVEAELQALLKEQTLWQERAHELENLRRTWEEDAAMSACIQALRQESEQLTALKAERTSVEEQTASVAVAVEKLRAEQQARLACAGDPVGTAGGTGLTGTLASMQSSVLQDDVAATAAGHDTVASIGEAMKRADYEAAQTTARHARAMATLQREVDALTARAAELQQLRASIEASLQEMVSRTRELNQCRESQMCRRCAT